MKLNARTCIVGERVVLVPYKRHHVATYNAWMSSEEVRELTASEPLSLDDEYAMRDSWEVDDDKLTFIVLRRDTYDTALLAASATAPSRRVAECEVLAMVGDVNAFIYEDEEDASLHFAEMEVMIADKANRGHGFGLEAVYLLINYCAQRLPASLKLTRFVAKIGEQNAASIGMFKKLGFVQYDHIAVFKLVCLKLDINEHTFPPRKETTSNLTYHADFKLNINDNYSCE